MRKMLLLKIFDAAYMQRWNDKLRPIELTELDKQAHKMFIAYFIARFEPNITINDWIEIIKGGLFDLLQRIVLTDIKPPVFHKIKADKDKYKELVVFTLKELNPYISPLGGEFSAEFEKYLLSTEDTLSKRILDAAHNYATKWEFDIIERLNPNGYEIPEIKADFIERIERYNDLEGVKQIAMTSRYRSFIDLCGELRYQTRWSHRHRIPKTSVLAHSLFVANLAFLFSYSIDATPQRIYNNYFTGLFHDLPEVLTRDIISPVKRSIDGLSDLIKQIEKEQMEDTLYRLMPDEMKHEIIKFTEDEFDNITERGEIIRDGKLVKVSDELAAVIEAYTAIENGCTNEEFQKAFLSIKKKYTDESEFQTVSGIDIRSIFTEF